MDQLEVAIARLGAGSLVGEAAYVLFGLDPDARSLTLQDRRDRAAQTVGIRGGWDSFRKGWEKRILWEVAEQLYRLERSDEARSERSHRAPASLLPASHQLPPDVAHFTGRKAELVRLRAMLADEQAESVVISAIAGSAGVGKTALALHLAHEVAPSFPDAQLYVNLHGYEPRQCLSPTQVLDRFLRALGVADEVLPTALDEQIARYQSLLSGKRALVVLDNASSADQVRALLPAGPNCLTLITSRDRLAGLVAHEGVSLLVLDILLPKEAVELLSRIAGVDRVGDAPEAAEEIGRLCGYLPLAVRIAAARLVARPTMSLTSLARRLSDEQQRLGELTAGDMEIRASFALSYRALEPSTARLFRFLGLIPGPDFGPGVAAALVGTNPGAAEKLLEALVDFSLLEATPTSERYRFHDLLRLYARECLQAEEAEHEQTDARCRMLSWYLEASGAATRTLDPYFPRLPRVSPRGVLVSVFTTIAQALEWLEAERRSLVAAVHQAADWGLEEMAWRLPDALWSFFYIRKLWTDWEDIYQVGLAAARRGSDRRAEAWMLGGLGEIYAGLRHHDQALRLYWNVLTMFREVGDRYGEGWTFFRLGLVHGTLRRHDEALGFFQDGLAIVREVGDRYGEGWVLHHLGQVYAALRRHDEALTFYQESLAICREIGNRYGEGWALYRLGQVYAALRRHEEALTFYQETLAICREIGNRYGEGWALYRLGQVYAAQRRHAEALTFYREALAICGEVGDRWGEGWMLYHLGMAFRDIENIEEAHACWRRSRAIFLELDIPLADEVRSVLEDLGGADPGDTTM